MVARKEKKLVKFVLNRPGGHISSGVNGNLPHETLKLMGENPQGITHKMVDNTSATYFSAERHGYLELVTHAPGSRLHIISATVTEKGERLCGRKPKQRKPDLPMQQVIHEDAPRRELQPA